jgi:phage-related protein
MAAKDSWRLEFFATATGRCPVKEYLRGLSAREATGLLRAIGLLKECGTELAAPHARFLGDKLWELRVQGALQHRVLYFATSGRRLVLLHAFAKKTRRTPPTELAVARKRMAEYVKRGEPWNGMTM